MLEIRHNSSTVYSRCLHLRLAAALSPFLVTERCYHGNMFRSAVFICARENCCFCKRTVSVSSVTTCEFSEVSYNTLQLRLVFSVSQQPNWGLGLLIVEVCRSHTHTHTHTQTHTRTHTDTHRDTHTAHTHTHTQTHTRARAR